jgi:E3 ubiquitin-protein ligase UHRF1
VTINNVVASRWYEAKVTGWKCTSSLKSLVCSLVAKDTVTDCKIRFIDEVLGVEAIQPAVGPALVELEDGEQLASDEAPGEEEKCGGCGDNKNKPVKLGRKCRDCGCRKCGGKEEPNSQIMCDECSCAFHLKCIGKSAAWLAGLGEEDEWFCPECKNDDDIVGGSGKMTKKKMAAGTKDSKRDWGKGFACTGRNKTCTVVDKNHFGPIPGIEVGMSWMFRMQISEEGLHRPPVAGIAGTEKIGCPSLILSGGYEDDEDNGDTFTYTGAGGRDLSGNKRTAEQSFDQVLTKSNGAIARNCKARFDAKNGGDAGDKWREGKAIRVLRNYKGSKHSKYAPTEGNRYDGIYKCVRYWPQKGNSGFIVWRYELRRDDPTPAPWTKEGKLKVEEMGYEMVYPEGYLEAKAEKEKEQEKEGKTPKGKKRKQKADDDDEDSFVVNDDDDEKDASPKAKKPKTMFKIPSEWKALIEKDTKNAKLWSQVAENEVANRKELVDFVEETFGCIVCMVITLPLYFAGSRVTNPISTCHKYNLHNSRNTPCRTWFSSL